MPYLPKKLFLFFLIIFPLFIAVNEVKAESIPTSNPQEILYPSIENLNQNKIDTFNKAQEDQVVVLEGQGVGNFNMGSAVYNATNMIMNTCIGREDCPDQPTALNSIGQMMALMYANPPASGIAYTYDLLAGAGLLAKPAYAQGIGFSALSPFLPFWKVTRNISYMLLIIVMVAIGFMIIFRTKIDPKTVIGVQAALPKIVLTLILITFSYPIVGFMIDLMYLLMAVAISVIVSGVGGALGTWSAPYLQSKWLTAGSGDLLQAVFMPAGAIIASLKGFIFAGAGAGGLGALIYSLIMSTALTGTLGAMVAVGAGISLLILFILALGLLFTFIRLLLLLANSYIQLLISLILGPILLLGEAIPGKSAFSNWLLNIIANLIVFPATAVIILFSVWLAKTDQSASSWSPPFLGIASPGKGIFHALLSLAVMFMAPNLVASIKKAFKPKPVIPAGVGSAFAPLTGGAQTAMGAASQFYYLQAILERFKPGQKKP